MLRWGSELVTSKSEVKQDNLLVVVFFLTFLGDILISQQLLERGSPNLSSTANLQMAASPVARVRSDIAEPSQHNHTWKGNVRAVSQLLSACCCRLGTCCGCLLCAGNPLPSSGRLLLRSQGLNKQLSGQSNTNAAYFQTPSPKLGTVI